jgi:hypothetical protein
MNTMGIFVRLLMWLLSKLTDDMHSGLQRPQR